MAYSTPKDTSLDQNLALAQAASAAAASAQATAASALSIANGKNTIYFSAAAPNSTEGYVSGDHWYVMDTSGQVTAMYYFDGTEWATYQLDAATLNVGTLSALSADLGNVTAGTITGINIISSFFTGGWWTNATGDSTITLSTDGIDLQAGNSTMHLYPAAGYSSYMSGNFDFNGGLTVSSGLNTDWFLGVDNIGMYTPHVINSADGGDLYFEAGTGSGNSPIALHASKYTVSSSRLSTKRNVELLDDAHSNSMLLGTDTATFQYNQDTNADTSSEGVVIDDVNTDKKYSLPNELMTLDGLSPTDLMSFVSRIISQNKYQARLIEDLELRIRKLEINNDK